MRTTIHLTDDLLQQIVRETQSKTITQAIRSALEGFLEQRKRQRLIRSFGTFPDWNPDLKKMRRMRDLD